VVAAAGRGTAKLVLYPVRVGLRSQLGAGARQQLEDSAIDALAAPELEHLFDRLLAGPLPEAVARSLVEHHVAERMIREAVANADLEAAVTDALASGAADDILHRAIDSPAFKTALEEALASPAVRAALARQGHDAADDALGRLRKTLVGADDSAERAPRRLFGRQARISRPPEAGVATRGFALAVDAALVNLGFLIGVAVVSLVATLAGGLPTWLASALTGAGFAVALIAYFVFFWASAGSTPGMALMGLRVLGPGGGPVGGWRAVVRLAGLVISIALLFLGFVPALVSDRRRALPDYLAGTVVVRERR
jgi:uncharacterized RDD family membrane protein YckC